MVARKSVLIVANTVVGGLLGAVAIKLTAVYFGQDVYGEVGYALGLVGLFAMVTDLGFHGAHLKRVSEGANEADCIATFLVTKVVLTSLLVLLVLGMIAVRVLVLGREFETTSLLTILLLTAYYVFRSLYLAGSYTFDAKRHTVDAQSVLLAENGVRVFATALAAIAFAAATDQAIPLAGLAPRDPALLGWLESHGAALVAGTWVLGAAVALLVSGLLLVRHHAIGRFDRVIFRSYFVFALPIFLLSAIGLVSSQVDRVAVGYFWGDAEVGAYFGAQRVTGLVEAIPAAVGALLFPTLSALASRREHAEVQRTITLSLRYIVLFTLPLTMFLVVFGGSVFAVLLSNEWQGATTTLAFLAVAVFLYSLLRPYIALMAGVDRPGDAARIGIVMSVLNVAFTLVLVPADVRALGIPLAGLKDTGAAIALCASALVGLVMGHFVARGILGPGYRVHARWWAHGAAAATMTLAFWLLHTQTGLVERAYVLAAFGLAGFGVYVATLTALGEFTRHDVRFFVNLAHPVRFVREAFGRERRADVDEPRGRP